MVGRHEVNVSNPDKVFFPKRKLSKIDLVQYYVDVAPCALPHLRRRLFHMKRFPNGVDSDFFHQKRVPEIEKPDYLLIDLDPSRDGQWPYVREIALVVREVMDELGLKSFPKTSGSTGLHVLAPIRPELAFPEVRRLAKALAQEVERRIGDQEVATTTWKVADRRGVFVDYGQNARDRTIASAYSIRPTPDARASAPLDWEEVHAVRPERFTLTTMPKRIDEVGDLTKGMWRYKRSLIPLFPTLGLEPADPSKVDSGRRRGRAQRWESDQSGSRSGGRPRRASRSDPGG